MNISTSNIYVEKEDILKSDLKSDTILSSSIGLRMHTLSNRIVMASMSCLSDRHNLSQPTIADYYAKRASAGLIITEPTLIYPLEGFNNCPGIYSRQQVKKWREITEAVRDRGSKIFLQLGYCEDESSFCRLDETLNINDFATNTKDLSTVVKMFRRAAQNALAADFDGVEIHAAFGYATNHLEDGLEFSQNIEQQLKVLTSIIEEVIGVWDAIAMVDIRDIAAVATTVLTENGHEGKIYQITGAEALTMNQVVDRISEVRGNPLKYVPISPEKFKQGLLEQGQPEWFADALTELFEPIVSGSQSGITTAIADVAKKQPITFEQFVRDYSPAFKC